jgi:hypothetical protein
VLGTISKPLRCGADRLAEYYGIFDYYRDSSERSRDTVAVWGPLAERWGLSELSLEQFAQVIDGKALDGSGRGTQTQNGTHTAVIDTIYASPKSVDQLLLSASESLRDSVIEAFRQSVHEAHEMVHDEAKVCRMSVKKPSVAGRRVCVTGPRKGEAAKTQGSVTRRVTAELMSMAPVIQFAARPTDESDERGAPDPHLHAHVPVFGIAGVADAKTPGGLRYLTPDDDGIKRQAAERGDLALSIFARKLQALGIPLEFHTDRKGRISWEVAHTDPAVRRLLSSNARRAERLRRDHEEATGQPLSEPELQQRMYETRKAKTDTARDFDANPDWGAWRDIVARASGRDIGPYPQQAPIEPAPLAEREQILRARALGPDGLCRDDATFSRADIRPTLARCNMDLGFDRQHLSRLATELERDLVVVRRAAEPDHEYLSTKPLLGRERYIASVADTKATTRAPAPSPAVVEACLDRASVPLDDSQRQAVRAACAPNGWVNIEGLAGTGKTTALTAAVEAYRSPGPDGKPTVDQVIVVCVAAATAKRSGQKLGADHWNSVSGFCRAVQAGKVTPTERSLVIVDEACMVNTFQEADLLRAAGAAQIVNVGDPGQLTPIGAGGWYGPQAERHRPVRLRSVHRHKDPADTADFTAIHDGQADKAVAGLTRRGRVQVLDTHEQRITQVVADYVGWRDQGRRADEVLAVIDGANRDIDTVNRLIQRERRRRGELGGDALEVTATEEGRSWRLHAGDRIIFLTPYREGETSVRNGTSGEVVGLDLERRRVRIRLAGEDAEVDISLAEEDHLQPVGLSYAVHAAKFQGGEVPTVLALPGSARITNANAGYSAVTRAQESAYVYLDRHTHGADPLAGLARAWSRPDAKLSALQRLADQRRGLHARRHLAAKPIPSPAATGRDRPPTPGGARRRRADLANRPTGRGRLASTDRRSVPPAPRLSSRRRRERDGRSGALGRTLQR